MPLADARAIDPAIRIEPADATADEKALRALALWCQRYSPLTRADSSDGVTLDITGCAHLFGGESALAEQLMTRLRKYRLTARLAITPTIGASWAAARYAATPVTIVPVKELRATLKPFPVSALRIEEKDRKALAELGLRTIGHLLGKPLAPLMARFGRPLVKRLNQAIGTEAETFTPLLPPPLIHAHRRFLEPVTERIAIEMAAQGAARELGESLQRAGKGARRLELLLYRVDGGIERLQLRTSRLSRDANHLFGLLAQRLEAIEDRAGFGFEALILGAFDLERQAAFQSGLAIDSAASDDGAGLARLFDRLANRFGPQNLIRFHPNTSYLPENAIRRFSALKEMPLADWQTHDRHLTGNARFARPLLLFNRPEPIDVTFEIPDKPPVRFKWRRGLHRIIHADGPERIAPEWWQTATRKPQTRDYYRVEDEAGRRFWLYRDGLHERSGDQPVWYLHGILP